MSIVSEFYRNYADMPYREDYAEIVRDAVVFILDRVMEYWGQKNPSGGVDLTGMPGVEFGFKAMETQVFRKMPKKDEAPPFPREIRVTTLLGDVRQTIEVTEAAVLEMADKIRAVATACNMPQMAEETMQRIYLRVSPPEGCDIYAVCPPCTNTETVIPVLYNLELGEIYYASFYIGEIRKSGKLHISSKQELRGPIMSVNWITGETYFIGYPVLGVADAKRIRIDTAWKYREPDLAREIEIAKEFAVNELVRDKMHELRKSKTPSISLYGRRTIYGYHEIIEPWMDAEEILARDPFALARAEVDAVTAEAEREIEWEAARLAETMKVGPLSVMSLEDRDVFEAAEDERRIELRDKGVALSTVRYDSLPRMKEALGSHITTSFLEKLYELPEKSLDIPTAEVNTAISLSAGKGTIMLSFLNARHYAGNLFQALLQTSQKNSWFLPMLLGSLRHGGKTLAQTDPDAKNISKWLGLTRPDYDKLMDMEDEGPLVFMLLMNQIKPTSYKDFERCYEKVLELDAMWLKEFDLKGVKYAWSLRNVVSKVKNQRGKILFETLALPQAMAFYTRHNLRKTCSPLQYLKYIIDEGKRSCDSSGKYKSLRDLEKLLEDYNRMARSIAPKAPFALPHNLMAAHDTMVDNFNRINADKESAELSEYAQFARCYADKLADVCPDKKFTVLAPASSADLYEEGILLNHCVGSYGADIVKAKGNMLIYFLRLRSKKTHPLVTIQVDKGPDGYTLTEVAGKGNRLPTEEEQEFCNRWIDAFNAEIKKAETKKKKEGDVPSFNSVTLSWLTTTAGLSAACIPWYNATLTKDENYAILFDVVADCVREQMEADTLPMSKKEYLKKIYEECGRNKLSVSTIADITGKFEAILKKRKATA